MSGNAKIRRLIHSVGTTRVFQLEDASVIERSGGSASWRNNNPGNLKFEFKGSADRTVHANRSHDDALANAQRKYAGIVGLDQWGNAVFESPEAGRAAQAQLLRTRFGGQTVEQMVHGYSRPDYTGPTHYAQQIQSIYRTADAAGTDLRGKTLASMTAQELNVLADGIGHFEGFKAGHIKAISGPALNASDPEVATASPMRDHATHTGQLHAPLHAQGDAQPVPHAGTHGVATHELQAALNRLGYANAQGHRLVEDGRYGQHTRDAVAGFQKAHGFHATGAIDAETQIAVRREDARLLSSPSHPDHRIFEQVLRQVHVAEDVRGIKPGMHSLHVAGALVVEMRRVGMERADRIEINRDGSLIRAVQASALRDESGLNHVTHAIDTQLAAHQSVRTSSEQLAQINLAPVAEHELARQQLPAIMLR